VVSLKQCIETEREVRQLLCCLKCKTIGNFHMKNMYKIISPLYGYAWLSLIRGNVKIFIFRCCEKRKNLIKFAHRSRFDCKACLHSFKLNNPERCIANRIFIRWELIPFDFSKRRSTIKRIKLKSPQNFLFNFIKSKLNVHDSKSFINIIERNKSFSSTEHHKNGKSVNVDLFS
jgi:hypothetical protein